MNEFIKGDRVILISLDYGDSLDNPVWDRNHGCVIGTVDGTGIDYVTVWWDNDKYNTYRADTLKHAPSHKENDPNRLFIMNRRKNA